MVGEPPATGSQWGATAGVGSPGSPVTLTVLYGGRSAEHLVSCVSAFNVVRAVDPARYRLRLVGIATDGRWVDAGRALARQPNGGADPGLAAGGPGSLPAPDTLAATGAPILEPLAALGGAGGEPVVVLPLLHGPMGEDGTVQGLLELAGVPYCGTGVAGSALAMDKALAKAALRAAGLPQPRHLTVRDTEVDHLLAKHVEEALGWPVFVKPANMGSSIGVSRVLDPEQLPAAVALACRYDEHLVIEEAVEGRELEVGVLGWPDLRATKPGEIVASRDFYDFADKYVDGRARTVIPAGVPATIADEAGRLAVAACRSLRVDSMARVDFFYDERGRQLLINEVNTIPGFTPISMYPKLWAEAGLPYSRLIDELVDQALRRAARRARFEVAGPAPAAHDRPGPTAES